MCVTTCTLQQILNLYLVSVFILQRRPFSSTSTVHSQFSRVIGSHTSDQLIFKKLPRKTRYTRGIHLSMP